MPSRTLGFALALLVAYCGSAAATDAGESFAARVDLPALRAYAVQHNPEIAMMEQSWRAARTRPSQEGSLPDPLINAGYHNESFDSFTLGSSNFSWVLFGIEQELPFPGKLGLKETVAEREAEREGALYRATVLNVITHLRVAYSEYVLANRSIEIVEQNKRLLETLADAAQERYRVGEGIQQDVLRAQVEVSILVGRLTSLDQMRKSAAATLNAILNRPPSAPLGDPQPVAPPEVPYTLQELEQFARERSPNLQAADFNTARADSDLSLARRQYYPDFVLRAGYYNLGALLPEWEVGVGVRVPLYFWRKQEMGVEEAAAGAQAARSGRQGAAQDILAGVRDLHARVTAADRLVKLYGGVVVPQADGSLNSALAAYRVGEADFLTLLNNFTVLNDYQLRYAEERANLEKAVAQLEELCGLAPELPPPAP